MSARFADELSSRLDFYNDFISTIYVNDEENVPGSGEGLREDSGSVSSN